MIITHFGSTMDSYSQGNFCIFYGWISSLTAHFVSSLFVIYPRLQLTIKIFWIHTLNVTMDWLKISPLYFPQTWRAIISVDIAKACLDIFLLSLILFCYVEILKSLINRMRNLYSISILKLSQKYGYHIIPCSSVLSGQKWTFCLYI